MVWSLNGWGHEVACVWVPGGIIVFSVLHGLLLVHSFALASRHHDCFSLFTISFHVRKWIYTTKGCVVCCGFAQVGGRGCVVVVSYSLARSGSPLCLFAFAHLFASPLARSPLGLSAIVFVMRCSFLSEVHSRYWPSARAFIYFLTRPHSRFQLNRVWHAPSG